MVDYGNASKDRWVCPNDRQLALRAKLKTGWSVKTQSLQHYGSQQSSLDESEQEVILQVIKRAEMLEVTEQERVGRLVDRLENMKRHAMGNGTNQCVLCGDSFGMLGAPSLLCHDCKKAVCHKCGIETLSAHKEPMSLCKICSETREMWKKSGAWFFKGLPKYVLPEKKSPQPGSGRCGPQRRLQRLALDKTCSWSRAGALSLPAPSRTNEDEESSSEDETSALRRRSLRHLAATTGTNSIAAPSAAAANGRSVQLLSPSTFEQQPGNNSHNHNNGGGVMTSPGGGSSLLLLHQRSASVCLSLVSDGGAGGDSCSSSARTEAAAAVAEDGSGHFLPPREGSYDASYYTYAPQQQPPSNTYIVRRESSQSAQWWGEDAMLSSRCSSISAVSSGATARGAEDLEAEQGVGEREERQREEEEQQQKDYSAPASLLEHAQLGTIELSLLYDSIANALHCSLHRAKGLKPMDINGLSDPFCRLNILPTGGKSNRLRTKTVHKTRNPEFNETLTFYGVTESDMARKVLHILVLDDDKYGHDFIGEARVPLIRVQPQQVRHLIIPLEKHFLVEQEDEVWGNDAWTRGQILVTLCYSTRRRALVVGIVRCANLIPMDNNGFSDPFVKLRLKPDTYHKKYKTSTKWKNLNPVFNEEFVFDAKMTELPKQFLEITVWDKDYGKSNDYLGGLELGFHSKGERLKHWVDMIKFPDHKHEGWHNLGEEILGD